MSKELEPGESVVIGFGLIITGIIIGVLIIISNEICTGILFIIICVAIGIVFLMANGYEQTEPKTVTEIKPHRKTISGKLRWQLLKRDNFTCQFCGRTINETPLHLDHILPVSKGGMTVESNLQTLCEECNLKKSNK